MDWGFWRYVRPGHRLKHDFVALEPVISAINGDSHHRRTALVKAGKIRRAAVGLIAVAGPGGRLMAGRVVRSSRHAHPQRHRHRTRGVQCEDRLHAGDGKNQPRQ